MPQNVWHPAIDAFEKSLREMGFEPPGADIPII